MKILHVEAGKFLYGGARQVQYIVEGLAAAPYGSGLSVIEPDEAEMGVILVDMGAGSTSVAIFERGDMVHLDAVALGGGLVGDAGHSVRSGQRPVGGDLPVSRRNRRNGRKERSGVYGAEQNQRRYPD